jgi:hypothetical protein
MRLKKGVRIGTLAPQMVLGCMIVDSVYKRLLPGYDTTITAIADGRHGPRTLHGKAAVDWRTKDFNGDKYKLRNEIKAALGADFDVVLEDLYGPNEHIHTEYDP